MGFFWGGEEEDKISLCRLWLPEEQMAASLSLVLD